MHNGTRKAVHWVLALVIWGQALAAVALPCGSVPELPAEHASVAADIDPHAGHHAAASTDASAHADHGMDEAGMSCCDGGYCSANGCLSLPAVTSPLAIRHALATGTMPASITPLFQSLALTALFRPPAVA